MATTGPNLPAIAECLTANFYPWEDVDNAKAKDSAATRAFPYLDDGDHLRLRGFGFSIPSGATIDGVSIRIRARATGNLGHQPALNNVGYIKGGAAQWPPHFYATELTGSYAEYVVGNATSLPESGLTPSDVNDDGFGIYITVCTLSFAFGDVYAEIDWAEVTVHYTDGAGSSTRKSMCRGV